MSVGAGPTNLPGLTDLKLVGRGGFSRVYLAYQETFARHVAVKILELELDPADDRTRRRFVRECQAMGRLASHPNIVSVHDAAISSEGLPYIVMEYCSQGSLASRISQSGPLQEHEALDLGLKMAQALSAAHAFKILHRDVKPANILFTNYGQPALADL